MSYNICVIGAGYWGKKHILTLSELGLLGGIVDSDKVVLSHIINQYPEVSTFQDLDVAIKNEKFDGYWSLGVIEHFFDGIKNGTQCLTDSIHAEKVVEILEKSS